MQILPQILSWYRSENTKTCHFKWKKLFWGRRPGLSHIPPLLFAKPLESHFFVSPELQTGLHHCAPRRSVYFTIINDNKAFIDIRLRPGVATPLVQGSRLNFQPFTHSHTARYGPMWCHRRNRKYITCRNAARGEPSHGHKESAQKASRRSVQWFQRYARGRGQTRRQTDRNTLFPNRGGVIIDSAVL